MNLAQLEEIPEFHWILSVKSVLEDFILWALMDFTQCINTCVVQWVGNPPWDRGIHSYSFLYQGTISSTISYRIISDGNVHKLPFRAAVWKQRWFCPQLCSVFSSHPPLYLPTSSLMNGKPEDQEKGDQRRGERLLWANKTDKIGRSVLRAIRSVRKAIHWVSTIPEGWMSQ